MRFFNTAGPMIADDHYLVPPLSRVDLDNLPELIEQKRYFVLHAPRQTGKTKRAFGSTSRPAPPRPRHCAWWASADR